MISPLLDPCLQLGQIASRKIAFRNVERNERIKVNQLLIIGFNFGLDFILFGH